MGPLIFRDLDLTVSALIETITYPNHYSLYFKCSYGLSQLLATFRQFSLTDS